MSSIPAYNLPTLVPIGDELAVINSYQYKEILKEIGCRWQPETKSWNLPLSERNLEKIARNIPGLKISREVAQAVTEAAFKESAMRDQMWQDAEPLVPMPIKGVPYQHQVYAFNWVSLSTRQPTSSKWGQARLCRLPQ